MQSTTGLVLTVTTAALYVSILPFIFARSREQQASKQSQQTSQGQHPLTLVHEMRGIYESGFPRPGGRQMWVPIIEWTILMLHGGRADACNSRGGLETASRFKRRKDFPGCVRRPDEAAPDRWAQQATSQHPGTHPGPGWRMGLCLRPSHRQSYPCPAPRNVPSRASVCGGPHGYLSMRRIAPHHP